MDRVVVWWYLLLVWRWREELWKVYLWFFLANQFDTIHLFYIHFLFLIKLNRRGIRFMESAAYLNRREGRVPGSVSNPIPLPRPCRNGLTFPPSTPSHLVKRVSTLSGIINVYWYKYLFVVKIIAYQLKNTRSFESVRMGWSRRSPFSCLARNLIETASIGCIIDSTAQRLLSKAVLGWDPATLPVLRTLHEWA